jgi:cytochrome c oxidase assembly protein subunit 15
MIDQTRQIPARLILAMQILVGSIIVLMAFGAYVRTMNAGLTCPDWPLCFGKVIPEYHFGVYLEFIHRAYAGLETFLFLYCLIKILRNPIISKAAKRTSILAACLLIGQIVMGGLTVILLLKSVIVTTHLALAALFMASLLWTTLLLKEQQKPSVHKGLKHGFFYYLICALPLLIFIQLLVGGLVASTYSGLVCLDFPKCNGEWLPTLEGSIGLQVIHRFYAYFVALVILSVRMWAAFDKKTLLENPKIFFNAKILFMFVVMQIFWGIMNLKIFLPSWGAVIHHLTGVLLFALAIRFTFIIRRS